MAHLPILLTSRLTKYTDLRDALGPAGSGDFEGIAREMHSRLRAECAAASSGVVIVDCLRYFPSPDL